MFVYDAVMESIKYGNNCITGPASLARGKLEKLAMVNPITEMSGYESQFKVCYHSDNCNRIELAVLLMYCRS